MTSRKMHLEISIDFEPRQANHSHAVIFARRVESKSLPIEVNNSSIELHLPVKAKEKLAMQ